ncbi:protein PBDC1 isoform X6 [Mus musculus]|uniref:protein PBDC1 isoform X6 n=1 Tax=Mus musculus TaxID=10090 RepID=UPI0003D747C2|nr:protein PBDC1 isoform X6 [Mus musculus]|eukprot:XP_006528333.1 PREDICTED: protein PBDC1 isoform X6 [Mus musculus]
MDAAGESEEPVSGEALSIAHALSHPPESYGNDPDIEMAWAIRAMQHAEVYYKLISSVDPQFLKLTKVDDQIYSEFREIFETLRVDVLDPEELKSESAKEKWRPFCLKFEGIVEDYNYGTLLRLDCSQGYTEENTIFGYYPGNQTLQCWLSVTSDSTLLVYPFLISEDCTLVTVAYISIS